MVSVYEAVESVKRNGDGTLTAVSRPCGSCGSSETISVPELGFLALAHGAAPREALPQVPAGQVTHLLTGTCDRCRQTA